MSSCCLLDAGAELTRVLLSALVQAGGLSQLPVPHTLVDIGVSFDFAHLADILADEFEKVRVVDLLTLASTNPVEVLCMASARMSFSSLVHPFGRGFLLLPPVGSSCSVLSFSLPLSSLLRLRFLSLVVFAQSSSASASAVQGGHKWM